MQKFLVYFISILASIALTQEAVVYGQNENRPLEVCFLDVGQGDATLINYQNSHQMLIDGGPDKRQIMTQLSEAMPVTDKTIEIVVLTHPDADHLVGLIEVVKNYEVGLFLDNGQKADTEIFRELEEALTQKGIKREVIGEGSNINFGKELEFEAFNPDVLITQDKDRNEQSVVLRMDYGQNSFLFTGDASEDIEMDILQDKENIDVEFLKVGHHGSKSSSSDVFLDSATVKTAIISSGEGNRYKHPHGEVLDRLSARSVDVLRTDQRGMIKVECDEEGCERL